MKLFLPLVLLSSFLQASVMPDLASRIPAFGQPESGILFTPTRSIPAVAESNQDNLAYKTRTNTYYPSVLLRIGVVDFDFGHFNQHVLNFINQQFKDVIPYAGLSYEFPIKLRKGGSFDNYIEFNYFLPQDLKQQRLFESSLTGLSGTIATGRDVAPTNTQFDMVFAIGLTGGRLHYVETNYINNYAGYAYAQYYFGPMFMIQPKFIFGQFVIGARGSYRIDILNQKWSGDYGADQIPPAGASGWTAELIIGVQLGAYY
jgi:hypothetical protein